MLYTCSFGRDTLPVIKNSSLTIDHSSSLLPAIRAYWNARIHDQEIATHPPGSPEFFRELDIYRFEKLTYLPHLVNFAGYMGKTLLEIGCGAGIDLVRFAQGGALVTGVDLAEVSIALARKNFETRALSGALQVMNGEALTFPDNSFGVVYAHGVLQYTADPAQMIQEIHRVLRPGGEAILMVYNKYSWLSGMSKLTKVDLEHEDAPAFRTFSIAEFKTLLQPFTHYRIIPERFPVKTQLHHGTKATLYNQIFVKGFNLLPKALVRPLGWHLMAFAQK
jgi:ubiquinone/menaquinone biosynthesis C-methylase UbiE